MRATWDGHWHDALAVPVCDVAATATAAAACRDAVATATTVGCCAASILTGNGVVGLVATDALTAIAAVQRVHGSVEAADARESQCSIDVALAAAKSKPRDVYSSVDRHGVADLQGDDATGTAIPRWGDDAGPAGHREVDVLWDANDLDVAAGLVAVFQTAAARVDGQLVGCRIDGADADKLIKAGAAQVGDGAVAGGVAGI